MTPERSGYQVDIDSYFKLDDATGPVWSPQPDPASTSGGLELSTGASDAVAYHDFYRLQIAFEDVWAELIDESIGTTAREFYAKWDALMNAGMGSDVPDQQFGAKFDAMSSALQSAQAKINLVVSQLSSSNSSQFAPKLIEVMPSLLSAITTVTQIQSNASDSFKSGFGLDMQNLQVELQATISGLGSLFSAQPGSAAPVTNALAPPFRLSPN